MTATQTLDPTQVIEAEHHRLSPWLDRLGIVASLACVVHCLLAPVVLLILPATGWVWSHPAAHWILAALVLPLALVVVYRGYLRHRRRSALAGAVLGAAFIVAGLVVPSVATGSPSPMLADVTGVSGAEMLVGEEACSETCCPAVTYDAATGTTDVSFPLASVVTLIGSVLLVLAHAINLHGCRCFTLARDTTACGCPASCESGTAMG